MTEFDKHFEQSPVYLKLRDEIVNGELSGGTPIVEDNIAARYGVSRTPVREALKILEQDGLVEYFPYKGRFVKRFGVSDMVEVYTMRMALEGISCGLVAENHTPELMECLKALIVRYEAEHESTTDNGFSEPGFGFHLAIVEAAGNTRVIETLDRYHRQNMYIRHHSPVYSLKEYGKNYVADHQAIYDAIERSDSEAAERLMREHLQSILDNLLQYIRSNSMFL